MFYNVLISQKPQCLIINCLAFVGKIKESNWWKI